MEPINDDTKEAIARLISALSARGLPTARTGNGLIAQNIPEESVPPSVRPILHNGLNQELQCRSNDAGELWWYWVWRSFPPDGVPELESLCPATDPHTAAARIANVIALDPTP